ncbi:glycosyltransferase family 4 protein [Polluticaenibacter yanchengensis]|uniref:glycosyltransferase family 4 protein n=1 Tax=Polluticaenibacter yanchengensis TaxID=3014562 RepID=UPI00387B57E9
MNVHICFIADEYPLPGLVIGGIGSFLFNICSKLVERNIQVTIIGFYKVEEDYVETNGINIHCLKNSQGGRFLKWYYKSDKIQKKIEEVHAKNPISYVEGGDMDLAFVKKIPGIKYGIRMHGGHHFYSKYENKPLNKWKAFQEKLSYKKADVFIGVSQFVIDETAKVLNLDGREVYLINYPINTEKFKPVDNIAVEKYSLMFAGTVCEKKGIRQLILALPAILEKYPQTTLNIYGKDWFFPDGSSYINYLKKDIIPQLQELAFQNIIFHGPVSIREIPRKYAAAHVCVFPSHMETLGLVAPEAMAVEKLVVFTKEGPGPEVIEPYKTGLLCDPHDPEDIAAKIIWYFDHENETSEIGRNARQSVLNKFGLDHVVEQNLQFLNKLINNK